MRGSKRKLREGVWELRIALGRDPVSGTYRRLSKTFRGSAREADVALRSLIEEQAPSVDGVGATFAQLLDQWLEECERLDLSPTTMRTYRSRLAQMIRPSLGKIEMRSLSPEHLDDLYGAMKAAGKSPKTIRNHYATISAALHQGVRWGWVRANVAERTKPPRVSHRRVRSPSIDEVRRVIEAAEQRDQRLACLLMLAAMTGMRRGELCAICWSDVDLATGTLEVSRPVVVVPGGVAEKTTKSDRSRTVALDSVGVSLLDRFRETVCGWLAT